MRVESAQHLALSAALAGVWPFGVTLNVVAPGPVAEIESLAAAIEQSQHGPAWQGRSTTSPQDIAFLCSEAGRFMTAAVLPFHFCS